MTTTTSSNRRPKLGQHFLADAPTAARIVESLGDIAGKIVIEIGPGRGVLTTLLARRARHLIAIELDRVLAAQLRMKYNRFDNVEIIEADVRAVQFDTILGPRPGTLTGIANPQIEKARVVGNIPYYITSDILLHLLEYHTWFDEIVIMTQLEVADRIVAKPGSRDYGLLSATVQLYARAEKLFTVPPEAFAPPPKVRSAVIRLSIQPSWEQLQIERASFIEFLRESFGQKRKTLVNNLKARYDAKAVRSALAATKLSADARAESVPLEKAAALFRLLPPPPAKVQQKDPGAKRK
ncbi:MAG: 16S rRNA (adenine(1518)-N(6)/adenine(1519)-N(6))-dimethyltransferase RsmA [Terriglobales bacterium]|jgi:16S rRNA (adenine1518-N6/adenine1519-N6)-dimethyltransferase